MFTLDPMAATVMAASYQSSGDGDWTSFAVIFLLAGFIFYGITFMRYRNVDKRHHHEYETDSATENITREDTRLRKLTDLSNSKMHGANNHAVRGSGQIPRMLSMKSLTRVFGQNKG